MNRAWKPLAAVCALVIGVYAYVVQPGVIERVGLKAADAYYNLLVQGFRAGQLSVNKEAPPALAKLADPYVLSTSLRSAGVLDLSYYKGRLYLYFGVTPALILFGPFAALTGHYLFHRQAVMIFCGLGFLASVGLLRALWRRYFTDVSLGVVVACVVALGLAAGVPVLLSQADVWEVPISCGYMLTMLALGAIWYALHEREWRGWWLMAASAAYGLAVGARPSLLFGAIILLVPVVQAWRERRKIWALLMAATGPIVLIGLGLMLYNALRFNNPFEFGQHYQLHAERQMARQFFSLHYLWFNFRVYFLEPVRWTARSPFVQGIVMPPVPAGHSVPERPFGVLTTIPLVWLALAVPLAWRDRSEPAGGVLRWFVTAVALLSGISALTVGLFYGACARYEVDFLPGLVLLAVIGILSLERALAPTSESGQAGRPVRRRAVRWGWGLLLGFSVAFNLLAGVEYSAERQTVLGSQLFRAGKFPRRSGTTSERCGSTPITPRRTTIWEPSCRRRVGSAMPSGSMNKRCGSSPISPRRTTIWGPFWRSWAGRRRRSSSTSRRCGSTPITPRHTTISGRSWRNWAGCRRRLSTTSRRCGSSPISAKRHYNLGMALAQTGKIEEAIAQYEQALRINPDDAEAHCNLGIALGQAGKTSEAIEHLQQALRIKPHYAQAQNALARLQAGRQ